MSWERGAGFKVVGAVVRAPYVNPSRTFAKLVVATPGRRASEIKHELRTFDAGMIAEVEALGVGQTVKITGAVENEALKNKAKEDVKVDGYQVWVARLTIKAIDVEGASIKPATAETPKSDAADTVGW